MPGANIGTSVSLGTGATPHDLTGDRMTPKIYNASGATDAGIGYGEIVYNSFTEQIFTRRSGNTHLIHALRRYHPTSSTDANVWEGEMVISTSNNDLYCKSNGSIRRVATTVYS